MTRAERLAQAEERARAKLEVQRKRLAQVQARQRDEERRSLHKRRLAVGMRAEEAGLFALDDMMLARLFHGLAPLMDVPDPVAVLEALLSEAVHSVGVSVPGCAQAAPGVAPAVPAHP